MKYALLCLLLAGCGSTQPMAIDAPAVVDAPAQPSVAITLTPTKVAPGETVTLAVTLTNHTLVDPRSSPPPRAGEGHYHYYLDGAAQYTAAWTPSVSLRTTVGDAPGVHTVRVVLVTSAHVEITPLVETTATFTIE